MAGRSLMRRIAILAIVCLLLRVPCLAKGEQLTLFTEEYPPINYSEAGRASGLGSAIVSEIMRRAGIQASIEVVPWARGYRTVLTTPNTGLFVTARTPQREAAFRWVGPLVRTQGMLYGRRGDFPLISVLEDAAKVDKLAVPRDWYLQQILENAGFKNLHFVVTPLKALQLLHLGRVALVAIDDVNLEVTARELSVDASEFVPLYRVAESHHYLALSLGTPEPVVQACRKALETMKADGTLAQLYRRWLPGVAPP
ncbi:transporter substrate-binding domain-containing protein [Dechloromonas sp. ZS-1]|uniref:substrate-binding periplasmic protein n=1 Tax=Dechloromonas sp. ZS-1 TaxID=3138067 RepID=UPI0031FC469F